MTLETRTHANGNEIVTLVECPFCETELGKHPTKHLEKCAAFYRAFDVEVPEKVREFSPASGQDSQPERAT